MLGRIQGDVKHILEALIRNQEQFKEIDTRLAEYDRRLDKTEKFQVKVATILAIAAPILVIIGNGAMRWFGV